MIQIIAIAVLVAVGVGILLVPVYILSSAVRDGFWEALYGITFLAFIPIIIYGLMILYAYAKGRSSWELHKHFALTVLSFVACASYTESRKKGGST